MGKSPAKWFKSVLSGKKGPKVKIVKGDEKAANQRELVVGKATERGVATETIASLLSDADSVEENLEMGSKEVESLPPNATIPGRDIEPVGQFVALDDPEQHKQDQSATIVQTCFRGYQARQAYFALKGIIKLQALIRGHLVRRQAVSTIHCMLGIVKLQARVRGKRIRLSHVGFEVQGKITFKTIWESKLVNAGKEKHVMEKNLSPGFFVCKFLVLSPKPLYLQYDLVDPNSVVSWLNRWSVSKFWKPILRKPKGSTSLDQNQDTQAVKTELDRAKRNNKLSSARVDNGSTRSSNMEAERSKRTFRKPSIQTVEISDPEAAKSELEIVKRNLRKVHEGAFLPGANDDKLKQSPETKYPNSSQNVSRQSNGITPEKTTEDLYDTLPTLVDEETLAEQCKENGISDLLNDVHTSVELNPLDNVTDDGKSVTVNEHLSVKQSVLDDDNQKDSIKETSQGKHESVQNGSNKQPKVPSYMLATKSAKAKLRDGSSLLEQEASEKSHSTRRHSLPSPTGTIVNSSPKTQKLAHSNGKPKNKSVKPLSASKDGSGKADWRR